MTRRVAAKKIYGLTATLKRRFYCGRSEDTQAGRGFSYNVSISCKIYKVKFNTQKLAIIFFLGLVGLAAQGGVNYQTVMWLAFLPLIFILWLCLGVVSESRFARSPFEDLKKVFNAKMNAFTGTMHFEFQNIPIRLNAQEGEVSYRTRSRGPAQIREYYTGPGAGLSFDLDLLFTKYEVEKNGNRSFSVTGNSENREMLKAMVKRLQDSELQIILPDRIASIDLDKSGKLTLQYGQGANLVDPKNVQDLLSLLFREFPPEITA